jgi:hypothetical protein
MTNKRQTTKEEATKQQTGLVWVSGVCRLPFVVCPFVCDLMLGIWCFMRPINHDMKADF